MKENYTKPVAEVETFAAADVITTSGTTTGGGSGPIELPDIEL